MKRALRKDCFKEIKKSYKRFISILLMAFLGVGFFAGVRATSPDMELTIDSYLDRQNVYDTRVVSTLGLTDDDVRAIGNLDNIDKTVGIYSEDVFVSFNEEEYVVKVYGLEDEINNVEIIKGRLPENDNECVIEQSMSNVAQVFINDYIEIREVLKENEEASFKNTKLKVVGIVQSPLYISRDRGTTTLGSGTVSYYMYVNKENIVSDIYTEIDISVSNAKELIFPSFEYNEKITNVKNELEGIKEERQNYRHTELITQANEKLEKAQNEFNEQKADAEKKISDAEKEIADGKKEIQKSKNKINKGEKELQDGRNKANKEFETAEKQIVEGENKLVNSQLEIDNAKKLLNSKRQEAEKGISQVKSGIQIIDNKISQLNTQKISIENGLNSIKKINNNLENLNLIVKQYEEQLLQMPDNEELKNQIKQLQTEIQNLENTKIQLEQTGVTQENLNKINTGLKECEIEKNKLQTQLNKINSELSSAEDQINQGQNEINARKSQINNLKLQLENTKKETQNRFEIAEKQIKTGRNKLELSEKELEDGEKELLQKKEEFNIEITKAEEKLIDAREKVNDIEKAKWYIFSRKDDQGYNSYVQDIDNVKKLGEVFPIVFFLIATLISLTSMSRMVEEERIQIGTLKAIGYNKIQIMSKYIMYSFLASIIGGFLGAIFGLKFFPTVIITMYEMMYNIKDNIVVFNKYYAFLGMGIMSICIVGTTIYTSLKELASTPSEMMRPKAPKAGKRVLLEKIPFIWNKFSFTQKVTLRNMFRYKKRFFMTVIGICGCTALILTGFGLKDSISKIMDYQYVDIYDYDMLIGLKDTLTKEEKEKLILNLENKKEIDKCTPIYMTSKTIQKDYLKEDTQIIVTNNPEELEKVIKLKDVKTGKKLNLNDNEIIITDKLSKLINVNIGDEINLIDSENKEYKLRVGGITEHYIAHYVYMTENLYNNIFQSEVSSNVLFTQYSSNISKENEEILSKEILENSKVGVITLTSSVMDIMNDTLSAMNFVVYVLIVSAGLLAFIVLYNLANINISERIRELATIKVLGFYDKEVYDYVTREIFLLTIIGIIIGLVFGFFLNSFILGTCEIGILRFKRIISIPSYIYSSFITIAFTVIVNFITYFSLKKVDMIESLKSVE